jgi:shikimate kinase
MQDGISRKPNVYLVGPMGVGKTTVGKLLSDELDLEFVDIDREVEFRAGADIPWIFDVEGEEGFRIRESRALEEIAARRGQLIATGGGVVLSQSNREIIKKEFCVYLKADLSQLVARIGKDKKRPLLQKGDPCDILMRMLELRDPLYREVATCIVQTDSRPMRQVVREIVRLFRLHNSR